MIYANFGVARPKNTKICDAVKVHVTFANIVVARPQLLIHISPSKLQMYLIYFRVGICITITRIYYQMDQSLLQVLHSLMPALVLPLPVVPFLA